jgi:hypothetical protein
MDWPAIKIGALSLSIYRLRQSTSVGGRSATRLLANRCMEPVLGVGNTRVTPVTPAHQSNPCALPMDSWIARVAFLSPIDKEDDVVNNVAVVQVDASFAGRSHPPR